MSRLLLCTALVILMSGGSPLSAAEPLKSLPPNEQGVVNTAASPNAVLHSVPIQAVTMKDGFWRPRMEANRTRGLPDLLDQLEEHGVVDNYRRMTGRKNVARRGPYFSDSDLYKWMEGASWVFASTDDKALRAKLDAVIDDVLAAQKPDGYLNTFFVDKIADERFRNMPEEHELYCAGHLFQAAVAYYRATGSRTLLDGALRYADYVAKTFGPGRRQGCDGHPEVEMALVELYRVSGERKYLDTARFFLDQYKYLDQQQISGHAVRAGYAACGATDYFMESGDRVYLSTAEAQWRDMTSSKMYLTGGIGATRHEEAFGAPYELPNQSSYAETCAAISNVMWNWRMLAVSGDARYADVMETALYNGFLSGVSLKGNEYFYVNPMESGGGAKRVPWFGCTCCPTNVVRMFSSMPGYMYSTGKGGLWVHLYDNSELNWRLDDGTKIRLTQETKYPWDERVTLKVEPAAATEFGLFLRIPGWCARAAIAVNGEVVSGDVKPGTYHEVRRTWKAGDTVTLDLAMPVTLVACDPRVRENRWGAAVTRGPLVYCFESPDNNGVNVLNILLPADIVKDAAKAAVELKPDKLGGIAEITLPGQWLDYGDGAALYRPLQGASRPALREAQLHAIPYYAWANRGDSKVIIWVGADWAAGAGG